jgi:hypothetical protein
VPFLLERPQGIQVVVFAVPPVKEGCSPFWQSSWGSPEHKSDSESPTKHYRTMGNNSSSSRTGIGLKLDQAGYQAGDVLKGRVYLALRQGDPVLRNLRAIHVLLQGAENVEIERHIRDGSGSSSKTKNVVVDRSTRVFVRTDLFLAHLPSAKSGAAKVGDSGAGQYEYPFQYRLPDNLPGTMHCSHKDCRSFAEVRYTLTAYLAMEMADQDDQPAVQASTAVYVKGRRPNEVFVDIPIQPLRAETEAFPVKTCCFWNKGVVHLGWQIPSPTPYPGETIPVRVWGNNQSSVDVQYLWVRCVETVHWKAADETVVAHRNTNGHIAGRPSQKSVRRVLAEQKIGVTRAQGLWQPVYETGRHRDSTLLQADDQTLLTAHLRLPKESRLSYAGRLVRVHHTLIVTAVTKGGCATSSPESACQIRILPAVDHQHQGPDAGDATISASMPLAAHATSPLNPTAPTANLVYGSDNTTYDDILQAQVLPDDWKPSTADEIILPEASAVFVDDGVSPASIPLAAGTNRAPSTATPINDTSGSLHVNVAAATAPEQHLLDDPEDVFSNFTETARRPFPTNAAVAELRRVVTVCPQNLPAILEDPSWATAVQNLSPRDLCTVLQSAVDPVAPRVARSLGTCMGSSLTCRHLLACLWSLPEGQRMDVVRELAPLASDLPEHQRLVEQELDRTELLNFRAALKS